LTQTSESLCARSAPGFLRGHPKTVCCTCKGSPGFGPSGPKKRTGKAVSNNYWSSTTYALNSTNAWNVNFNNGNVNNNNKTNNNYVRCVR